MIFDALFGSSSTLANPQEWMKEAFGSIPSSTGENITPMTALRVSAVFACVKVLSESISQLPIHLYHKDSNGIRRKAEEHPLYNLLNQLPSRNITAFDNQQLQMVDMCLGGTHYSEIMYDRSGKIGEIVPIEPWKITTLKNPKTSSLFFEIDGGKRLPSEKIWRICAFSPNGITGYPPVDISKEAIGLAMAGEKRAAVTFKNAAVSSGVVTTEEALTTAGLKILKQQFNELYSGLNRSGNTMFLDAGMKYEKIGNTPADAQFLENRKYQNNEIARIYRVPPHLIGDLEKATFSNIEHQAIEFVVHSLGPWLRRIEQTISRDLLTPFERKNYYAKFNFSALLRGDTESRHEAYAKAIANSWLSPNEVRNLEDMNSVDGLDFYTTPLNMGQVNNEK